MTQTPRTPRSLLDAIAARAMVDYGLAPQFPPAAREELQQLEPADTSGLRDLRDLPWSSIDNDSSRDLDQLEVCVRDNGRTRVLVAVADVEAVVGKGTAIDAHARTNTTSVYTVARVFPMLPEPLSTDRTSLNEHEDRAAVVVEMAVTDDGSIESEQVYAAAVRNGAKLAYPAVAAWLDGHGPAPQPIAERTDLAEQIRLQDRVGQALAHHRQEEGALEFERGELTLIVDDEAVRELHEDPSDRARGIIENFMVAANGVVARFLTAHGWASIRRVVRAPKRWPRIVEIAGRYGAALPEEPDPRALQQFLAARRAAAPDAFPELSLTVLKLLGRGEYVASGPGGVQSGHFALAESNYTHSTAPNRRFPDLVTQRLVKAALARRAAPYSVAELHPLAEHCTRQEDAASKVERRVRKSAAALWMSSRIGEEFEGVVTGASGKGTWVKVRRPDVEGKVEEGWEGLDVGERVRVRLIRTDAERGFVDFAAVERRASGEDGRRAGR